MKIKIPVFYIALLILFICIPLSGFEVFDLSGNGLNTENRYSLLEQKINKILVNVEESNELLVKMEEKVSVLEKKIILLENNSSGFSFNFPGNNNKSFFISEKQNSSNIQSIELDLSPLHNICHSTSKK